MSLDKYAQENNVLANDILRRDYFLDWKSDNPKKSLDILFSTNNCGKCHKCYFKGIDDDIQVNLDNFSQLLDWYIENEFKCDIRLSGNNIWVVSEVGYFDEVMNTIITKFSKTTSVPKNIFISVPKESFVSDEYVAKLIDAYNKLFAINIVLNFEIDANGQIIDGFDDTYYLRLFNFINLVPSSLLFATITQSNLGKWLQQVVWWTKRDSSVTDRLVINEEFSSASWTELGFNVYCNVIDLLISYYVGEAVTEEDKLNCLEKIFVIDAEKAQPFQLHLNKFTTGEDLFSCDMHNALTIRCSDLSVFICGNLCNEELKIGSFNIVDNKIIDFNCNTVELFIVKEYSKVSSIPYCEQCPFVGICDSICLAHSYNTYSSPLVPVMNECEFQKNKLDHLVSLYNKMGLFDVIDSFGLSKSEVHYIKDLADLVVKSHESK